MNDDPSTSKWLNILGTKKKVFLGFLITMFWVSLGFTKDYDYLSAKIREKILDGKSVATFFESLPETTTQRIVALAVIQAPVPVVWKTLIDYSRLGKGSPMVKIVHIEPLKEGGAKVKMKLDLPWPLADMGCNVLFEEDADQPELFWKNVGGCVKTNVGTILLEPFEENKTLLKFSLILELGNIVPQWIVEWGVRRQLPKEIDLIRTNVHETLEGQRSPKE